jgi:hypothetical protein
MKSNEIRDCIVCQLTLGSPVFTDLQKASTVEIACSQCGTYSATFAYLKTPLVLGDHQRSLLSAAIRLGEIKLLDYPYSKELWAFSDAQQPVEDRVLGVMKFGSQSDIAQFAQGLLYMNTLDYFTRLEQDLARHDLREGAAYLLQAHGAGLEVEMDGEYKRIGTIAGAIHSVREGDRRANILCLYTLRMSGTANSPLIDVEKLAFGDYFALLLDAEEFL